MAVKIGKTGGQSAGKAWDKETQEPSETIRLGALHDENKTNTNFQI